jgi:hypothetical protein
VTTGNREDGEGREVHEENYRFFAIFASFVPFAIRRDQ